MKKYDVRTGLTKIKTKTAIAVSAITLTAGGAGIALAVPAISHAAGYTDHFPGNNDTSCNAWHGAPGGFGPDSPYYTVAGPQDGIGGYTFGQAQGGNTGPNNSNYSAYCNQ